jgi:hypothetical protein
MADPYAPLAAVREVAPIDYEYNQTSYSRWTLPVLEGCRTVTDWASALSSTARLEMDIDADRR